MASYAALVQSLVKKAIVMTGDLSSDVIYYSNADPDYDTTTGEPIATTTTYTFTAPVVRFGLNELDSKTVIATDAKLLAPYLDLPVEPRENDTVLARGKTWKVIRTIGTPGDSLWVIHLREV